MILRGRNLITGLPEAVEVSSVEIREALSGSVQVIVDAVKATLDETPPELVADLMEYGIVLAGGGACCKAWPNACRTRHACTCMWPTTR